MKNNLQLKIKKLKLFFEINRLDRGLFRFWILGTGLFYFFVLILLFSGEINQFNYLKKRLSQNMGCATSSLFPDLSYRNIFNKKEYVGPNKYLIITAVKDGIKVLTKEDTYFGSSLNGAYVGGSLSNFIIFNKKEHCERYISKSIMLFEFILIFAWLLLLPLFAVPTWLLGKKTVLWLIRGFK